MKTWLCALFLCQAALPALAQSTPAAGPSAGPAIVCGGVGKNDQDRMKAEAAGHDLMITFSATGGAYVADVEVEIARGKEVVTKGVCQGPLMLVDVGQRGRYEIRARSGGKEQRKTVELGGGKLKRLSFVFPRS